MHCNCERDPIADRQANTKNQPNKKQEQEEQEKKMAWRDKLNQFNGWQRLWMFVSVLWAVPMLLLAADDLIDAVQLHYGFSDVEWDVDVRLSDGTTIENIPPKITLAELVARLRRSGYNVGDYDASNVLLVLNLPQCAQDTTHASGFDLSTAKPVEERTPLCRMPLPHKLLTPPSLKMTWIWILALAVLPPIAIYLLGMGVAWVRAGFNKKRQV